MAKHKDIDKLSTKDYILIKGARVHNLKNIDVAIPRNKLVVITGLSGSGKSSLAFDTLYAEGQRRYVESLSSYARQFLGRIDKPDVDYIKGISPAIAIEQKVNTSNTRSTVGTSTEIYDYLKLLFARVGKTISPLSGNQVKRDTVTDVVNYLNTFDDGIKFLILSPLKTGKNKTLKKQLELLGQQGFSRIQANEQVHKIEEFLMKPFSEKEKISIVIDRLVTNKNDEDNQNRIADSVQTAFNEGEGECMLEILDFENGLKTENQNLKSGLKNEKAKTKKVKTKKTDSVSSNTIRLFSNKFELDGKKFEEPTLHFFSFNNPVGACKHCQGFGTVIGIDKDLVIPNKNISVFEEAIVCWKGEQTKVWYDKLIMAAHLIDFPLHRPYCDLSDKEQEILWTGNKHFNGIDNFFEQLEKQSYKIQYRVMLSRFRGKTICPECKGTRLRKDATYVKVAEKSIMEIVLLPIVDSLKFFKNIKLSEYDAAVSKRILIEITSRLQFLDDVGLGYLTLNRLSNTLSGGESQRINLATSLGSSLVGSLYILDEPSIGLHSRDTMRLIKVLNGLRNLGNTVIVVEHDEEIMRAADEIIDIGKYAGTLGGELIFQGNHSELKNEKNSLTADYLLGKEKIKVPETRRIWNHSITIKGATQNNLKNISVKFPLNVLCVVAGVSGSGKTTLVKRILYPALKKLTGGYGEQTGSFSKMEGDYNFITAVEMVDQNPIGKSTRSNPVTYVKAYDDIRELYSEQPLSKIRGYKPSHFSFNVDGGRCEMCDGEGEVQIAMQFMADIHLQCETCNGKRFKNDILEITYQGKNIADILDFTIDQAIDFFEHSTEYSGYDKRIIEKIIPLRDVGLGYIHLGQPSSTLSGGEAQRIKLASFIGIGQNRIAPTLFIFDEPTTGLHFHDISKLLFAFNALLKQGHSIIIIEHNVEIIKSADWIIELGPEGGTNGGNVVFEGVPEDLINCNDSYTSIFLKQKLFEKNNQTTIAK